MREPTITIEHANGIPAAMDWVGDMVRRGLPAGPVVVKLGRPKRSDLQNAKLHAMLGDIAAQVEWYGRKMDKDSWKIMASAVLHRQEPVPAMDGRGFVVMGKQTRGMTKAEISDMIELLYAFGAEHSVVWSEATVAFPKGGLGTLTQPPSF
jgi:hypothetical protein